MSQCTALRSLLTYYELWDNRTVCFLLYGTYGYGTRGLWDVHALRLRCSPAPFAAPLAHLFSDKVCHAHGSIYIIFQAKLFNCRDVCGHIGSPNGESNASTLVCSKYLYYDYEFISN